MIEPYLLEELVTFAHTGTLAATAEKLYVTQPSVTRGMQKLEQELGVRLFERTPNRIILTPTGIFAAMEAEKLLSAGNTMTTAVRNFDRDRNLLRVASVLPGPLFLLDRLNGHDSTNTDAPLHVEINHELLPFPDIEKTLRSRNVDLVVSNRRTVSEGVREIFLGTEQLSANLDKFMYEASLPAVSFSQLKELSFIVLDDIGPWKNIIQEEIPGAKFLYQRQREAFDEITHYSNFPYFSTNLTPFEKGRDTTADTATSSDDRVPVPLSDEAAQMKVYAYFMEDSQPKVEHLLRTLRERWPASPLPE